MKYLKWLLLENCCTLKNIHDERFNEVIRRACFFLCLATSPFIIHLATHPRHSLRQRASLSYSRKPLYIQIRCKYERIRDRKSIYLTHTFLCQYSRTQWLNGDTSKLGRDRITWSDIWLKLLNLYCIFTQFYGSFEKSVTAVYSESVKV